jgi:hypothetical protein
MAAQHRYRVYVTEWVGMHGDFLGNISSLDFDVCDLALTPIAMGLFPSLVSAKALTLHRDTHKGTRLAEAISSIPSLRLLKLMGLLLPKLPDSLHTLICNKIDENDEHAIDFWHNVRNLAYIHTLSISFNRHSLLYPSGDPVSGELQLRNGGFGCIRLKNVNIYVHMRSKLIDSFCTKTLEVCESLQTITLFGVILSDDNLRRMATRSLTKLSLFGCQTPENSPVSWFAIVATLKRNPEIREFKITFEMCSRPFTFDDIHTIAFSCPVLARIRFWLSKNAQDESVPRDEVFLAYQPSKSALKNSIFRNAISMLLPRIVNVHLDGFRSVLPSGVH